MSKYILLFIVSLLLFGCVDDKDREIHLIPEDYRGIVYILYDQKDGAPEKYEKGHRVYEIPSTGVLKTQMSPNPGGFKRSDMKYFLINDSGKRTKKLKWLTLFAVHRKVYESNKEGYPDDSVMVFNHSYVSASSICDSLGESCIWLPSGYIAYVVDTFKNRNNSYSKLTLELLNKEEGVQK